VGHRKNPKNERGYLTPRVFRLLGQTEKIIKEHIRCLISIARNDSKKVNGYFVFVREKGECCLVVFSRFSICVLARSSSMGRLLHGRAL